MFNVQLRYKQKVKTKHYCLRRGQIAKNVGMHKKKSLSYCSSMGKTASEKQRTNNVNKLTQQMAMLVTLTARIAPNSLEPGQKSDGTNTDK